MSSFQIMIYAESPSVNKYALYEIEGFICEGLWKLNSKYMGDSLGITFSINTLYGIGYLQYINIKSTDTFVKFRNTSDIYEISSSQLPVYKGGTGVSYIEPFTILRGNGADKIIGTSDFIYKDFTLQLGENSNILILNTENATNLTTGSFITNGGMVVKKDIIIGGDLILNGHNLSENIFYALNNVSTPTNIDSFYFQIDTVKAFSSTICITVLTISDEYDSYIELKGLRKRSQWILNKQYIGYNTEIQFSITDNGQIQYTSPNILNWISTIIKFKSNIMSN